MSEKLKKYRIVPHRLLNGKPLVKPYLDSDKEVQPMCKKSFPHYKILIFKKWAGNGFGHDSTIFVWDIENKNIYMINDGSTFSDIVRYVESMDKSNSGT